MKTFIELIKRGAADRQIVLVNTARALKYLEDYSTRQSQLFPVLEQYHKVPDQLEGLKSEFQFLKEATYRDITNLQQALNVQQAYTTTLCTHVNAILARVIN